MNEQNALLTDLYQLTMMQGLFHVGKGEEMCVFDRFYRVNPFRGSYSLIAGLEHVIDYVKHLRFSEEDLRYLSEQKLFTTDFLEYLKTFEFTGDIWAIPEGTVVFPGEPLLRVHAPKNQAILLETALSMILNHESLIATKASRIRWVAPKDQLMEFGLRRAQGKDASVYGARAAILGGFHATSNVYAGHKFGIPVVGTMAHSWVMSFDEEIEAFRQYALQYPDMVLLLVDTYNSLKSGVPNAIRVFQELRDANKMPAKYGIRLDSGDIAYLSKEARKMMDEAGFAEAIISASNDLDEYLIADLKKQQAKVNSWGVGTKLITADGTPALGGVYKLAAEMKGNILIPKMKVSDNMDKTTNPGIKNVMRIYASRTGKMIGDLIMLEEEEFPKNQNFVFYDPTYPWKRKKLNVHEFRFKRLLVPVFCQGKCVYQSPSLMVIREYAEQQLRTLWNEYRRIVNPAVMKVNLSPALYELKHRMLTEDAERI